LHRSVSERLAEPDNFVDRLREGEVEPAFFAK